MEPINLAQDELQSYRYDYRPHNSLDLATPLEYYENLLKVAYRDIGKGRELGVVSFACKPQAC